MKKKTVVSLIAGIIVLSVVYFSLRNIILNKVLSHKFSGYNSLYGLQIKFDHAAFNGFTTFYMSNFLVVINNKDTLMKSDSIMMCPKILRLITGHVRFHEIRLYKSNFYLTYNAYRFLRKRLNRNASDTSVDLNKLNYAHLVNELQEKIFEFIPSFIIIRNSEFFYANDTLRSSLYCENFSFERNNFTGDIFLRNPGNSQRCLVSGILDPKQGKVILSFIHGDSAHIKIPYIGQRWNALLGFDSLKFSLRFSKTGKNRELISGNGSVKALAIHQKRIGPDTVNIRSATLSFNVNVGDRYFELDSSSSVTINHFTFSPYIRYDRAYDHVLTCAFIRKEFEASDLFKSFPEGLFTNFKGLETKGKLAYNMRVRIDFDHPDSVQFESKLENKGFGIKKYGVTDFTMLNREFSLDVYDKDKFVKTILVGPDNPDFVALQDISPYLQYSVLTSEDGDFYYHHGFNLEAFRESIITNLKEKRFARGGSTITMQLVKNAFLNRNKTISRKVEEALIVWIIENLHLVSKERMFEVYLNIIEWGPGIYGIKPAAKFYFNKLPVALTLSESIYLSSIIPRPKGFRYTFVKNGEMAGFYAGYSKLMCNVMRRRNQITSADSAKLKPYVKLTGEAKKYLATPDTLPREDSLFYQEPDHLIDPALLKTETK